jgi:Class II flagellar assembly regulator
MRIYGPNATARVAGPPAPKRAATGGFAVAEHEAPKGSAPAAALRTIGGIEALIALQGRDERTERRRRAVSYGRVALDALDELKVELLAGTPGPSTLMHLTSATAGLKDGSGDARLDAVLAEIELRLAVEIAKISPSKPRG